MKKKPALYLLPVLLVLGAAAFFLPRLWRRTAPAPYNLLLITLDTTRADRLGCYGDRQAATPALDALAASGTLFENCYTPVPLTLPAHASLMTGRWPIAHGVRNNGTYKLDPAETTLAEAVKTAGYDTAAIIAAYVLKQKFGLGQGFDRYDDRLAYEEKAGNIDAEIAADRVYEKFRKWLAAKSPQPFFLWIHFYDPHKPYAPPADYLQAAAGDAYRGEMAFMDQAIGRIVADLKQQRLFENTLIAVVGDHGEAFGEHGEKGHGIFCYDESLKVPLILANPALIRKPVRIAAPVSLVDVAPTVLAMLGIGVPEAWQGKKLAAAADFEKDQRPLYFESMYGRELKNWAPLTGLLKDGCKYISLPQSELYDLAKDAAERDNLFFRKNIQARQMDRDLARFIREQQQSGRAAAPVALSAEDRAKLAALGYVSGFAPAGQAGIDPKKGIAYEERFSAMSAALDRGETAWVEAEALRLRDETAGLKLSLAYIMLGYVYERTRQWQKLEANLKQACELFKDHPGQVMIFQLNLLEFYLANDRLDAAEALAGAILSADPERTRVLEILGEICARRQDWPAALNWYVQASRSEADNASLAKKVIAMRLKNGDTHAALEASETLLRSEGAANDSELLFSTAMLAIETGNGRRSEELLQRLSEIQPTAKHLFDYALVLGRNGKPAQAAAVMEKALATVPNDLDAEMLQVAAKALQVWKSRRR